MCNRGVKIIPVRFIKAKHRRKLKLSGRGKLKKMMRCIFLGKQAKANEAAEASESLATRDYSAHLAARFAVPHRRRSPRNIEEAESSLRESEILNYEEARALLGRLEFQKGNIESAFYVFEGIDFNAVMPNIKAALSRRCEPQRDGSQNDALFPMSMNSVSILFEAMYLKSKALQVLRRFEEAAQSCQLIMDTVESAMPEGINGKFSTNRKLQETINEAVELLPELWKLTKASRKAMSSYRRALLYGWNLKPGTQAKVEKGFAKFLLYGGENTNPPTLRFQMEGAFVPSNNIEEAIHLLLLVLKKFLQGKIDWDSSVMDNLTFALSMSGELGALACQLEALPDASIERKERCSTLALCYHGQGEDLVCLNLLRNLFKDRENRRCTHELLLASKICAQDTNCSEEGFSYSHQVIKRLEGDCKQLASKATCFVGVFSSLQSRLVNSESKRVKMLSEALDLLETADNLTNGLDANTVYHLALENAEQRKLDAALSYAWRVLKLEAGSGAAGWVLVARILSAQKHYDDAETIVNVALEQTGKWDHAKILRTKAKLQLAQGKTRDAIETCTHLLAILQVQKKSSGNGRRHIGRKDQDKVLEMKTWLDLADIYTKRSQWQDAEVCLSKAEVLCPHSASRLHSKGLYYQARGLKKEAQKSYWAALDKDPNHVPSLISMARLLPEIGEKTLPIARSFIRQAISVDRTNHLAWQTLGLIHRCEPGGAADATECFQAAAALQETAPVEPFS